MYPWGIINIYDKEGRYHIEIGETLSPIKLFREEYFRQSKKWKKIKILNMDANEYFNKVRLSRGLIQLIMCNLVKDSTGKNGLGTYFRGEKTNWWNLSNKIYCLPGRNIYPNLV